MMKAEKQREELEKLQRYLSASTDLNVYNTFCDDTSDVDGLSFHYQPSDGWHFRNSSLSGISTTDEDFDRLRTTISQVTDAVDQYNQNERYTIHTLKSNIQLGDDGPERLHVSLATEFERDQLV